MISLRFGLGRPTSAALNSRNSFACLLKNTLSPFTLATLVPPTPASCGRGLNSATWAGAARTVVVTIGIRPLRFFFFFFTFPFNLFGGKNGLGSAVIFEMGIMLGADTDLGLGTVNIKGGSCLLGLAGIADGIPRT